MLQALPRGSERFIADCFAKRSLLHYGGIGACHSSKGSLLYVRACLETMSRRRNSRSGPEEGPHIGALLRMAWQRVRARIYSGVRNDGYNDLTPAHVALFRFETVEGQRPSQVAESMQITKQSINDLIRDLERYGYARYSPDPSDGRARLIHLTPRGRRLQATARKYAIAAERELEQELGKERFRELHAMLLKINKLSG